MKPIHLALPIQTVSPNVRDHWATRAGRARAHRKLVSMNLKPRLPDRLPRRLRILITRVGPRMMDPDNSIASLKHVIDGVADALGIDDGDPRLDWIYGQTIFGEPGVEITLTGIL